MGINIYGLQSDFMQKSRKKHSKTQNCLFFNVNSAPEPRNDQKSPKKRITKSRFTQFFCIGMVYFGCLQVNPHIQAVQNMCSKGGYNNLFFFWKIGSTSAAPKLA